ncbi:MAG: C25 family peptidase propeptide domain-containing protein [Candidatus Zixiibacteriota bacterium]
MDSKKRLKLVLIISALLTLTVSLEAVGQVLDEKIVRKDKPSERNTSKSNAERKSAVKLLKSDERGCVVEIVTANFEREKKVLNATTFDVLSVPGYGLTMEVGHPQRPLKGFLLGLPPGAEIELKIVDEEFSVWPGYFVSPVSRAKVIEEDPTEFARIEYEYAIDPKAYSLDTFYPGKIAEVGFSGIIRRQRVVQIRIYPFQYNPARRELKFYRRIVVEVSFGGGGSRREYLPVRDLFDEKHHPQL